jgi:hypothetical protein
MGKAPKRVFRRFAYGPLIAECDMYKPQIVLW